MQKKNNFIILIIFIFIFLISGCSLQNKLSTPKSISPQNSSSGLFPAYVMDNGSKKWGYIDSSGKFVIKPKFDTAYDFQANNIATVIMNNLYGLIDKNGNYILSPSFEYITNYSEGFAVASKNSANEVVNEKGKTIYKTNLSVTGFKNGMCSIIKNEGSESLFGYIDKTGKVKLEPQYINAWDFVDNKTLVKTSDNKYKLIDTNGTILKTFDYADLSSYSGDTIVYTDTASNLKGYINSDGKILINAKFSEAQPFSDGFAMVSIYDSSSGTTKYGLINKNGEYVIKPDYTIMLSLGRGLYAVSKDVNINSARYEKKAIINSNGTLLTDYKYYDIGSFTNGYCYVTDETSTYFIDKKGMEVKSLPKFNGLGTLTLKDNIIEANIDQNLSYVTQNNKEVWKADNTFKLSGGLSVKEIKYRADRLKLVYYPQLSGLKNSTVQASINNVLKEEFISTSKQNNEDAAEELNTDIRENFLAEQNNNLLVIKRSRYAYPIGAAHGMPIKIYYHINLNTGDFYKLSDLFKPNASYKNKLNALLAKAMKAKSSENLTYNFSGIADDQPFHITKDSLQIYFSPYEIAPYAAGFPTFDISYKDIQDIINTNGSFWKSFDKNTNSTNTSDSEISAAINTYETTLNSAINKKVFTLVEPILYKDSNLYNSQKK